MQITKGQLGQYNSTKPEMHHNKSKDIGGKSAGTFLKLIDCIKELYKMVV